MAYETIVKEGNFHQTATGDYGFPLLEVGEASVASAVSYTHLTLPTTPYV